MSLREQVLGRSSLQPRWESVGKISLFDMMELCHSVLGQTGCQEGELFS